MKALDDQALQLKGVKMPPNWDTKNERLLEASSLEPE